MKSIGAGVVAGWFPITGVSVVAMVGLGGVVPYPVTLGGSMLCSQ